MIIRILKHILQKRMSRLYKETEDNDYSDCGFPEFHLQRDLYYTYQNILNDDKMRKYSFLSKKVYIETVSAYYSKIADGFDNEFYMFVL